MAAVNYSPNHTQKLHRRQVLDCLLLLAGPTPGFVRACALDFERWNSDVADKLKLLGLRLFQVEQLTEEIRGLLTAATEPSCEPKAAGEVRFAKA